MFWKVRREGCFSILALGGGGEPSQNFIALYKEIRHLKNQHGFSKVPNMQLFMKTSKHFCIGINTGVRCLINKTENNEEKNPQP